MYLAGDGDTIVLSLQRHWWCRRMYFARDAGCVGCSVFLPGLAFPFRLQAARSADLVAAAVRFQRSLEAQALNPDIWRMQASQPCVCVCPPEGVLPWSGCGVRNTHGSDARLHVIFAFPMAC